MHAASPRAAGRAVLAALALALAACSGSTSGPGGPVTPPACKGLDQACGVGAECCSGDCPAGACGCSAIGEKCGTSGDCCTASGPARCGTGGTCVSGQRPLGDVCDGDGLCSSLNCDLTGHCAPACAGYLSACTSSAECCGYLGCPAGSCTAACGSEDSACTNDNQCCSDFRCRAGKCQRGLCGTLFHDCASEADCCTAAQGGKEYFCDAYGTCNIGQPYHTLGHPPDACATDADCDGTSPCRGGYCHWPDGTQADGAWCLDGQECDGGHCTSTAPGVPGTCCSGAGAACTVGGYATVCCSGLDLSCSGVPGAQRCGTCLDSTNSGPQGTTETQCTTGHECCTDRNLRCVAGECCTTRGAACTDDLECCSGDTCGSVTTSSTTTTRCCGGYGAACSAYGVCCDGQICKSGTCLKGPGEACTGSGQCAEPEVACNPAAGTCCSHPSGPCDSDADCCSSSCDTAVGRCNAVPAYGSCLDDGDCYGPDYGQDWSGQVCGGSASLGAGVCCPVPGESCQSAADCCEATDACRPRLTGSDTTTPVCCREAQAITASTGSVGADCCTGMAERRSATSSDQTCCALPWMTTFTCTSDLDCCGGADAPPRTRCDLGATNRCCAKDSRTCPGQANAAAVCCTGRVDNTTGCCTLYR